MASLIKTAQAGTLESSDIMITVAPGSLGSGVVIELQSIVMAQYGEDIYLTLEKTINEQDCTDIFVTAQDRGALDCTIHARILTALSRAGVVLKEGML